MSSSDVPAVVITGASRGLGRAMAHRLAEEGFTVFAGMRRPHAAGPTGVVPVALDVTDLDSVAATADEVAERLAGAGLHALVNNAAVLQAGPLELAGADQIDGHLRTNVAGPVAVTQAFLPLMRVGGRRIVNVSSINAHLPLPHWALYSASKAALVALSDALRLELATWDFAVTVLTLGAFATDIRARGQRAWDEAPADPRYASARSDSTRLVAALDAGADDPDVVGETVAELLRAPRPAAHVAIGTGVDDLLELSRQPIEVREAALTRLLAVAAPNGAQ